MTSTYIYVTLFNEMFDRKWFSLPWSDISNEVKGLSEFVEYRIEKGHRKVGLDNVKKALNKQVSSKSIRTLVNLHNLRSIFTLIRRKMKKVLWVSTSLLSSEYNRLLKSLWKH
jgi:hypothetical protein